MNVRSEFSKRLTMKLKLLFIAFLFASFFTSTSFGQICQCETCNNLSAQRGPEWTRYWTGLREQVSNNTAGPMSILGNTQIVFLDFDSGTDGDIEYSPQRREDIQMELERIYERFNVSFVQTNPGGDFSTLFFNTGGAGGGVAEDIDFRNLNRSDNAVLNLDGIGLEDDQIVPLSSLVAAHELGHLLGLRHADMFGPIGEGVLPGFGGFYLPDYEGPANSFEASDHIMGTPAFGIPFESFFETSWFSERSSSKLTFAEFGSTTIDVEDNDSIETAQPLPFQALKVPNTIIAGVNTGNGDDFSVSAAVVEGSLNGPTDGLDIFEIEGRSGDLLNLQVLSFVPSRLSGNSIDANLSVFDSSGAFVDYYGVDAFNENELKSTDCNMIDLLLPSDGKFYVQVDSQFANEDGIYELFVYRFNGVLGDLNGDGIITLNDVLPFVDALVASDSTPLADINCDGLVDLLDVGPFVDLINGQ
ncbi:MAG: hypothetical protein AAGA30_00655 [Planctomycetota bacterium]